MAVELKALPYEMDGLEPFLSVETLEYHYGVHAKGYIDAINGLLIGRPDYAELTLASLAEKAGREGATRLAGLAGQALNHEFYFDGLAPTGGGDPPEALAKAIREQFGSFAGLREAVAQAAGGRLGSGWVWWLVDAAGAMSVAATPDAQTHLAGGDATPLWVVDVWEHAYYLDFRNRRDRYVEGCWGVIDWGRVEARLGA